MDYINPDDRISCTSIMPNNGPRWTRGWNHIPTIKLKRKPETYTTWDMTVPRRIWPGWESASSLPRRGLSLSLGSACSFPIFNPSTIGPKMIKSNQGKDPIITKSPEKANWTLPCTGSCKKGNSIKNTKKLSVWRDERQESNEKIQRYDC